jgi:hypothetical protein
MELDMWANVCGSSTLSSTIGEFQNFYLLAHFSPLSLTVDPFHVKALMTELKCKCYLIKEQVTWNSPSDIL